MNDLIIIIIVGGVLFYIIDNLFELSKQNKEKKFSELSKEFSKLNLDFEELKNNEIKIIDLLSAILLDEDIDTQERLKEIEKIAKIKSNR